VYITDFWDVFLYGLFSFRTSLSLSPLKEKPPLKRKEVTPARLGQAPHPLTVIGWLDVNG